MENIIFITVLGDSRYYKKTKYTFKNTDSEIFAMSHWYSSFALLKYLDQVKDISPNKIFVLYPNTEVGKKSYEEGWSSKEIKNSEISKKSVKGILANIKPKEFEIKGIQFPNVNSNEGVWNFLNSCLETFESIENSSVIVDITHGFRIYQNLLFSFLYYFENISSNKLEKVYYALFQGEGKETPFLELDQLIMLQQEISNIRLLIKNLDIGAVESLKTKVRALKSYILTLQKVMLLISNGIVVRNLLPKINYLLEEDKFVNIPNDVFTKYDLFLERSFINGIRPELRIIRKKIFGQQPYDSKIWERQLNLADLLLKRKSDISTSLQLIRESFISWLSEEIYNQDPLEGKEREKISNIFKSLRKAQSENLYDIHDSCLFGLVDKLSQERNNFAHVFTTSKQFQIIEKKSQNILEYIQEIQGEIEKLNVLYKSDLEIKYIQKIINKLQN